MSIKIKITVYPVYFVQLPSVALTSDVLRAVRTFSMVCSIDKRAITIAKDYAELTEKRYTLPYQMNTSMN